MRFFAICVITFFLVLPVAAQVTVGTMVTEGVNNIGDPFQSSSVPLTWVNLSNPARAAGTVSRASVGWSDACPGDNFKVVFLRPSGLDGLGNIGSVSSFGVVAVRGPFSAVNGINNVTLSPAVSLVSGDLIGVVRLTNCGVIRVQQYTNEQRGFNLYTNSDMSITGAAGTTVRYKSGYDIQAIAYGSEPLLAKVVPAAGSVQGASAFFRTSLQMMSISLEQPITGTLVFHPAGQAASPNDPSLAFTINPFQVLSYADIVAAMGTSGLGSLDVLITSGSVAPIVTARVFSDSGSAGTSGFAEEGLFPNQALALSRRGIIVVPTDLTNYRVNVGVRTLQFGASLGISTRRADGSIIGTQRLVTYPPNYFEQVPLNTFAGVTVEPGGSIQITIPFINTVDLRSSAFIYSSVIDNRTSDSSYRLVDVK